jgi:nitrogen permease regulator 3-like protein
MPNEDTTGLIHANDTAEYEWKRPNSFRDRSISFSNLTVHPTSPPSTSFKDDPYMSEERRPPLKDDYDDLFGYPPEFLAKLLCPQEGLCHQKFELLVDDLAFLGHPVSAEADGVWRFKAEKNKQNGRGREYRSRQSTQREEGSSSPVTLIKEGKDISQSSWPYTLHTFHLVLVLDRPDPSSAASGNVSKYFDIIYEQIVFTVTAVLFQEQVLSNFVESECDALGSLKEECTAKGTQQII